VGVRRAEAVVMVVTDRVKMPVVMMVVMLAMRVRVVMSVMMVVLVFPGLAFESAFAFATSAYSTHHSTSSSLIFISSPPVTCN
jgi:hypothetical protein